MAAKCNGFTAAPCATHGAGTAYGLGGGAPVRGEKRR